MSGSEKRRKKASKKRKKERREEDSDRVARREEKAARKRAKREEDSAELAEARRLWGLDSQVVPRRAIIEGTAIEGAVLEEPSARAKSQRPDVDIADYLPGKETGRRAVVEKRLGKRALTRAYAEAKEGGLAEINEAELMGADDSNPFERKRQKQKQSNARVAALVEQFRHQRKQ